MSEYTHITGLVQRYGTSEAQKARVWTVSDGDRAGAQTMEVDLDWSLLPAGAASQIHTKFVNVPSGAQIEGAEVVVTEAYTSGTSAATLSVTLVDVSDYASNSMAIMTAATVAELTALGVTKSGASPVDGADLGKITAAKKAVKVAVGVESFTAGRAVLRIFYSYPNDNTTDTLGT